MSSVRDKVKLCSIDMNGVAVEKINGVPFYERYIEFEYSKNSASLFAHCI